LTSLCNESDAVWLLGVTFRNVVASGFTLFIAEEQSTADWAMIERWFFTVLKVWEQGVSRLVSPKASLLGYGLFTVHTHASDTSFLLMTPVILD
jgi:hypothetical protein